MQTTSPNIKTKKQIVRDFMTNTLDPDKPTDFSYFAEDVILHTPIGRRKGIDGLVSDVETWKAAFEDVKVSDVEIFEFGDVVIGTSMAHGTHTQPFVGIPATFRKVSTHVETTFCFENGKIVRYFPQLNMQDLFEQLGLGDLPASNPQQLSTELDKRRLHALLEHELTLSGRLVDCIALYLTGFSAKQIGENLHISPRTVEAHIKKTFVAVGCKDKHTCIQTMYDRGLLGMLYDLAILLL